MNRQSSNLSSWALANTHLRRQIHIPPSDTTFPIYTHCLADLQRFSACSSRGTGSSFKPSDPLNPRSSNMVQKWDIVGWWCSYANHRFTAWPCILLAHHPLPLGTFRHDYSMILADSWRCFAPVKVMSIPSIIPKPDGWWSREKSLVAYFGTEGHHRNHTTSWKLN